VNLELQRVSQSSQYVSQSVSQPACHSAS